MPCFICATCVPQFAERATPLAACPICTDDCQDVGWGGQSGTTREELAASYRLRTEADGEWSEALGRVPILINAADQAWVRRPA